MTRPTTPANTTAYLDERETPISWLIRLVKGIMVGIGFILPGLSGGVLAVIFRIYDPIIRFLSKPFHRFVKQVFYFIPIGIGAAIWAYGRFGLDDPLRRQKFLSTGQLDRSVMGS